jgi:hypothetical protein
LISGGASSIIFTFFFSISFTLLRPQETHLMEVPAGEYQNATTVYNEDAYYEKCAHFIWKTLPALLRKRMSLE